MIKKVGNIIINTIIAIILFVIFGIFILNLTGFRTYIVESGSMEPAIQTGSLCIVNTHADYDDIQTGDIIAFRLATGDMATHRVIRITPDGLETKGDHAKNSDGISTTSKNFVGQTICAIPKLGILLRQLTTQRGIILGITGILSLILLNTLFSSSKNTKSYDKIKEKGEKQK